MLRNGEGYWANSFRFQECRLDQRKRIVQTFGRVWPNRIHIASLLGESLAMQRWNGSPQNSVQAISRPSHLQSPRARQPIRLTGCWLLCQPAKWQKQYIVKKWTKQLWNYIKVERTQVTVLESRTSPWPQLPQRSCALANSTKPRKKFTKFLLRAIIKHQVIKRQPLVDYQLEPRRRELVIIQYWALWESPEFSRQPKLAKSEQQFIIDSGLGATIFH